MTKANEENETIDEAEKENQAETLEEKENGESEDLLKLKNKEIEETKERLTRLQADFINYKKRAQKEKENIMTYAIEGFSADLLPILDNFERAMEAEEDKEESFYKGVDMIYSQLLKTLVDNGVEEIDAKEKTFNPNLHHAVVMEESDEHEENTVIEVLQKGYMLKEKVIRPAMVKVSK